MPDGTHLSAAQLIAGMTRLCFGSKLKSSSEEKYGLQAHSALGWLDSSKLKISLLASSSEFN